MCHDPIVDEVRRNRHEIERECGSRERYLHLLAEIERGEQTDEQAPRPHTGSKPKIR